MKTKFAPAAKKVALILSLAMPLAISPFFGYSQNFAKAAIINEVVNTTVRTSYISYGWEKETNPDIEVIGIGLPPLDNRPGKMQLAKRAAIVDAQRSLAEAVNGIQVSAETTVEGLIVNNDTVRTHVSALIKGAKIIDEGENSDGSYFVKMSLPLYGSESIAAATIPSLAPASRIPFAQPSVSPIEETAASTETLINPITPAKEITAQLPQAPPPPVAPVPPVVNGFTPPVTLPKMPTVNLPTPPVPSPNISPSVPEEAPLTPEKSTDIPVFPTETAPMPPKTNASSPKATSVYESYLVNPAAPCTGIIIDANGMGLEATFSPIIYDSTGRAIYGIQNIDSAYAVNNGMVQYSRDLAKSIANSRAGENPLVIRATEVKGAVNTARKANVVVSPQDGDKILSAQKANGILEKCAVVFIR